MSKSKGVRLPPNTPSTFRDVIKTTSQILNEQFAASYIVTHKGVRGAAREKNLVREFLSTHFPPQFGYATGEVASADGKRSRQQDIIIYHATRAPVLYRQDEIQVVPSEAALAVVEVKTHLTSHELKKSAKQLASVKGLARNAYLGQHLNVESSDKQGILGYVFAYDSADLASLAKTLAGMPEHHRSAIDGVFVLNKGSLHYSNSRGFALGGGKPTIDTSDLPLMRLYLLLWNHLIRAWTPPIRLAAYFRTIVPPEDASRSS